MEFASQQKNDSSKCAIIINKKHAFYINNDVEELIA